MVWYDGKLVKNEEVGVSPLSHSLHYGGAVFEGIRFYEIPCGSARAVFRLKDHIDRLLASACAMGMEIPYGVEELCEAVLDTIKQSNLQAGYIRPIIFRGEGIGLMSSGITVHVMVAVMPWVKGRESVNLATSQTIRLHPSSTNINVKVAGHYVNSWMAATEAKSLGADDALLLDWEGNVAEASVANVFFVKGDKIFTPSRKNIFSGITRNTVIHFCSKWSNAVEERTVTFAEAKDADAMFLAGTACEVLPVAKLDGKQLNTNHSIVLYCRNVYQKVVQAGLPKMTLDHWLTNV